MDDQHDHDAVTAAQGDPPREWYIEARGASVGPLEGPALERMWRDGTIDADTLVWAAGFAAWLPLGDVPELSYLRLGPRDPGSAGAADAAWRPRAAPGVATLFRGEAAHAVRVSGSAAAASGSAAALPPPLPGLPVIAPRPPEPSRWRIELSGVRRTTITGLNHAWRALQDAQSRHRRMAILAVVMSACAIVASGGLALVLTRRPAAGPLEAVASAGSPAATAATDVSGAQGTSSPVASAGSPAASAATGASGAQDASTAVAAASPAAASTAPAAPPPPAASPASADGNRPDARATAPSAAAAPTSAREAEEDEGDDESPGEADDQGAAEADDESGKQDAADREDDSSAAAPLSRAEIVEATKGQVTTLAECIKQARRIGELQPRRYTFVLDWVIRADGGVSAPALKEPPELLSSGLRTCFEAKISGWRYRPSAQESPVANFPLAVNVP